MGKRNREDNSGSGSSSRKTKKSRKFETKGKEVSLEKSATVKNIKSSEKNSEKNTKLKHSSQELTRIDCDSDTDSATLLYKPIATVDRVECEDDASVVKINPTAIKKKAEQIHIGKLSLFKLPTKKELKKEEREGISPNKLVQRLHNTLESCIAFEGLPTVNSRDEYVTLFARDLQTHYNSSEFVVMSLIKMLDVKEASDYLYDIGQKARKCIRVNTLKINRTELSGALLHDGIVCEPIHKWTNVGLVVRDPPKRPATPELLAAPKLPAIPELSATKSYKMGHFEIVDSSSFLPVMALDPHKNEKIAHMLANYGDQTAHIADLMRNTGRIYIHVQSGQVVSSLKEKLKLMGVKNYEICSAVDENSMDRVLLSAPCSKTGLVCREEFKKTTKKDVAKNMKILLKLLIEAIDMARCEGIIVYSTNSFLVEENECIVDSALKQRDVKLICIDFQAEGCQRFSGRPGFTSYKDFNFDPRLMLANRFYPHVNEMNGTFIAKLQKVNLKKC